MQAFGIGAAAAGEAAVTMEDQLRLLRSCLALFEGVHAFHNFTKRRLYRDDVRESMRQKRPKRVHSGRLLLLTSSL